MKKLLLATRNLGKIKEIKEILAGIAYEIRTLSDLGIDDEVEEVGNSFEENAVLKAKTIGEKTGLLTLAEDSGLEVEALGGRPGIYSARYKSGTDFDRIKKVLKELEGVPKEKRKARFSAVVAIYIPHYSHSGKSRLTRDASRIPYKVNDSGQDGYRTVTRQARMTDKGNVVIFEGVSKGYITDRPIGKNGFGYDPIFFNLALGMTNGEASLKEKNRVSHRAKALKEAKEFLLKLYDFEH